MVDMLRHLLTFAALAGAVLALGACGGAKNDNSPKGRDDSAFDDAVKFAKCMRDNGVANFPDPNPDDFTRTPSAEEQAEMNKLQSDPNARAAFDKCRNLMPSMGPVIGG